MSLSGVLRREGDDRGWDGWMASPTQRTWIWVNSGSWWWTGRPGVLKSMGSHRVRHDWVTEPNWTEPSRIYWCYIIIGTGFKEKHILEQGESFCCVIISSGLKEKKKFYVTKMKECRKRVCSFLLLKCLRPLSPPWGPQTSYQTA